LMRLKSLRKRRFFLFGLTLLFLLFIISISKEIGEGGWLFSRLTLPPVGILTEGAHSIFSRFRSVKEGYLELKKGREENLRLKGEIEELKASLLLFEEIKTENRRLASLLQLKGKVSGETVAARIIGMGGGSGKTIIIDRGLREGVRVNMPVIAPSGVVGKVMRSSFSQAVVQLVTDPNSGVAARLSESRGRGVALGRGGRLLSFAYFSGKEEIASEELVVTSGLDGIFPPGLPLARVVRVKEKGKGLIPEITLLPLVDFDRLEEVLVIVGGKK
jgi:rod shape-determining protein MreC